MFLNTENKKQQCIAIFIVSCLITFTQCCIAQSNTVSLDGWKITTPFEQKNFIKNEGQCILDSTNLDYKIYFEAYTQYVYPNAYK